MTTGKSRPGPLRTLSLTLPTRAANSRVGLGVGVKDGVKVEVGEAVGEGVGVNVDVGVAVEEAVGVGAGTVRVGVAVTTITSCIHRASRTRNSQLPLKQAPIAHRNITPIKPATTRFWLRDSAGEPVSGLPETNEVSCGSTAAKGVASPS